MSAPKAVLASCLVAVSSLAARTLLSASLHVLTKSSIEQSLLALSASSLAARALLSASLHVLTKSSMEQCLPALSASSLLAVKTVTVDNMAIRKTCLMRLLDTSSLLRHAHVFDEEKEYWVHPINAKRDACGEFHHLFVDLKSDEERFKSYFRMFSLDISVHKIHKHGFSWIKLMNSKVLSLSIFFMSCCTKNVEAVSSCLELIETIWREHSGVPVLILEMTKPLLA